MDVNRQSRDGHCHPPFSLLNKRRNHREQGTRETKPTVVMARAGMWAEVTAAVLNSSCHRKRTLDPTSLFHSGRVEWREPGAGGKPVGKQVGGRAGSQTKPHIRFMLCFSTQ